MLSKVFVEKFQNLCKISNFSVYFTKRYIHRSFTYNKLIRLEQTSFQPRVLKYFINDINVLKEKPLINYTPENYKPDYLRRVNDIELNNMMRFVLTGNFPNTLKNYLFHLDKECCLRLPQLTFSKIFDILHICFYYLPHKITTLDFYNKSIHMLSFSIENFSKMELVEFCFYVGLQKKSKQSQTILTDCLGVINKKYLNDLNINDMAILCNSCYKTSTKIKFKPILNKFIDILNNNLDILKDPPVFIELVKSLRHNQYQNEELLTTISNTIFFNRTINFYNFTACAHILTLYADNLFYDEHLIKLLSDKCVEYLQNAKKPVSKKAHFSSQIRIKDLSNFVWSLSYLSYENIDEKVIRNSVEPHLKEYINLKNLQKDVENIIDILLSLYVLGYKPEEHLIVSVITSATASYIYAKRKQAFSNRFNLLVSCIKLEQVELFNKLNVDVILPPELNIDAQLKNRPLLKKVYESLDIIAPYFDIAKLEYTMSVPYLYILGISGYTKQDKVNLHVEVVDGNLLLQNVTDKASGFMNLKIRLLRKTNKNVLVVFQSEVEDKEKHELNQYLEKKLKRIYLP